MSVLRWREVPLRHVSRMVFGLCVLPTLLLGSCASDKASHVQGPADQQFAAQARKVEMEDDGQPVQSPPVRTMRAEEDDPTQPWSPNYGSPAPLQPKPGLPAVVPRSPNPYAPAQVDAAAKVVTTGSLTRLSEAEADMIIAQAINAHEMRR
jgi:hypothetical protein